MYPCISYHFPLKYSPILLVFLFSNEYVAYTLIILDILSIYIQHVPLVSFFVYIHYAIFLLFHSAVFNLNFIFLLIYFLYLYLKRNWLAVMRLNIGYRLACLTVVIGSLIFGNMLVNTIFIYVILSLVSFQVVGIKWKVPYCQGILVWIDSFEKKHIGIIV
eukprot:NODE_203_length_12996_cov_1.033961.p10 type:complete len:161 gc:universal NODE_203_length_12996_cov_1.033961:9845-9363(-)